ncbi:AMP-binding protein [Candidatus Micrarchaeota archaeon]|nr:AMP-binding protein [Candidatus Micrarchaeota archaeon]
MRSFLHSIPAALYKKIILGKPEHEIRSLQGRMLARIIQYANSKVPHYRANPLRDIRHIDGLGQLPITHKEAMRAEPMSFVSAEFGQGELARILTSGSTGEPMALYYSKEEAVYSYSLGHFHFLENGFGPLDTLMHIKIAPGHIGLARKWGLYRFALGSTEMREGELLQLIRSCGATMADSYPSKLALLAVRNASESRPLRLRCAFSHSETLTPAMRRCIETSFQCPVRNLYGLNEMGWVGWECPNGSMHVHPDSAIVEIVDDEGNALPLGKKGNIIITSLWRHSMPFIRYWTGDTASLGEKCGCGRGGQVLENLEGRCNDYITLPSGRLVPGITLIRCLKAIPSVLQFQIIQQKDLHVDVVIVPSGAMGDADYVQIADGMNAVLQEQLQISIKTADRIRPGAGGKHRYILSKCPGGPAQSGGAGS